MNEFLYNPPSNIEAVTIAGIELRKGDRVRLKPNAGRPGAPAHDGRTALIQSIEVDPDNLTQLTLLLDEDPTQRLLYPADEVEPLAGE